MQLMMFIRQKLLKHSNTQTMLRILFSLLCVKYFFFWFYPSIGFEENITCTKKRYYVSHEMMLQLSLSQRDKYDRVYFARSDGH